MSVQFLPWVRRGLAARLTNTDDGGDLPVRAAFSVSVGVNNQFAGVDVQTYGPGDVTGIDPMAILRVAPPRDGINVAPDEFAVIEFDEPDLPWLFTPASAGSDERLRPWLVLVVVKEQPGVSVGVDRAKPLPVLTIEAPAVPADELPDLSQSWAWAHAQVITPTIVGSAQAALGGSPSHSLSRIMCPRRLEPNTSYLAALVPAFDLGRSAGLGQGSSATATAPAWSRAALGESFQLPVYYRWDFMTGPAGDFESLARLLTPVFVPGSVGRTSMFVGSAHPALPVVSPEAGGVVTMYGALRAPTSGGTALSPKLGAWVSKLTEVVNRAAAAANDGTSANAEAVAPPIYGEWHVNVHKVPSSGNRPRWLRDLNADPRYRAAAGIGAELVRANQEEYVDAAWRQVGDVLAANHMLGRSRGLTSIAERLHQRHIATIDPVRALALVGRAAPRLPVDGTSVELAIAGSATLPGFNSRNFRRLASPRSIAMRQATKRIDPSFGGRSSADIGSLAGVPQGKMAALIDTRPDGVLSASIASLVDRVTAAGAPGIDVDLVRGLQQSVALAAADLSDATSSLRLRPDLAKVGVITDAHLDALRLTAGLGDDLIGKVAAIRQDVTAATASGAQVLGVMMGPSGFAAVTLAGDSVVAVAGGTAVDLTAQMVKVLDPPAAPLDPATTPVRRGVISGRSPMPAVTTVGPAGPSVPAGRRLFGDAATIRTTLERLINSDDFDLSSLGDIGQSIGLVPSGGTKRGGVGRVVMVVPPTVEARSDLQLFAEAFDQLSARMDELATSIPPPVLREPLQVETVVEAIVRETRPRPMAVARVNERLSVGGQPLPGYGGTGLVGVWQDEPLTPIMVGPRLERPLYLDLAAYDPGRFLPGGGDIPDNSIVLLETNQEFIEAFMVGVNHEFNRELLWRRYPTDRRGTAFHKFWDRLDDDDDIADIHTWPGMNRLGGNSVGADEGSLVLLIRGQLLRRYPNTVIYAVAATTDWRIDPAAQPHTPVFSGFLHPDMAFVGFDFGADEARSGNGTLFVLQEQPAEPRFGLDVPAGTLPTVPSEPPMMWSELTWGHVAVAPGGFLDVTAFGGSPERPLDDGAPNAKFGSDAAHLAAITFQRPFRVAIHSSEVLKDG